MANLYSNISINMSNRLCLCFIIDKILYIDDLMNIETLKIKCSK